MKKIVVLFSMISIVAMIVSCDNVNTVPVTKQSTVSFTAPGDDGIVGTAAQYDLRYATDSLLLRNSWATCARATTPAPRVSGTAESFIVDVSVELGIPYYFAIKAADEVPNWSLISNIVSKNWADNVAPSPILNFQIN